MPINYNDKSRAVVKDEVDAGLINTGSIAFAAGDDLTTEKLTSAITLLDYFQHPDSLYQLVIDKPTENTAGNLTVSVYNQVKVDATNERDALLSTLTVEVITGAGTFRAFNLQGLGVGEGTIKIGMKFSTDSGAITVYFKLYRL